MAPEESSRWEQIRARKLSTPALRGGYERTRRSVTSIRQVIQSIDAERERAGLTKEDLARRVGASPAAIRRLLTSDSNNPTLRTVLELFDVPGLELTVQPKRHVRNGPSSRGSSAPVTDAAVV